MTDPDASGAPEPAAPEPAAPEPAAPDPALTCPWCAASATRDATRCSACGAALAQRESIGDLQIPGLTAVDPALVDFDKRPLHLRGPSPTQGAASALIVGAVAGGPIGIAAIGGVAALAAVEFLGTKPGGAQGQALEDLGKPSAAALQALEHLDDATTDPPPATGPAGPTEVAPDVAADGGASIWRDLPPETDQA